MYIHTFIYVFTKLSNILYPIWECTNMGFALTPPRPMLGPSAEGPGVGWHGAGWAEGRESLVGIFPYWI